MTGAPGDELEPTGLAEGGLIPEGLDATLVLVRHGESEWIVEGRFQGQAETPLSVTGRRQAALVADRLARPLASPPLPVPAGPALEIVHSPLARTAETARAVAAAIDAAARRGSAADAGRRDPGAPDATGFHPPLRPDDGFKEINQGAWEGVTHDEIARRWGAELRAWRRRPAEAWAPGGESIGQVQARVRPALARILAHLGDGYPRGSMDGPQVAGYAGAGTPDDKPWSIVVGHDGVFKVALLTLFGMPLTHFWSFSFALCGITVVEFRGGRAVLRAHALTDHLAPLHDEQARERAEQRARAGAL